MFRNSSPEVVCNKDAPESFAKFAGKHLYQRLILATDLSPGLIPGWCISMKRKILVPLLSFEFCELLKNIHFVDFPF